MYPKTFEEFVNCAEYEGMVPYSALKIQVPSEVREDFIQDVYEYLCRRQIIEKFKPNYIASNAKVPVSKMGCKVSFAGYIYQYILFLWWKRVRKHRIELLNHSCSLSEVYENSDSMPKGCLSIDHVSFLRNGPDSDPDIEVKILVEQFRCFLHDVVLKKELSGKKLCKREIYLSECLSMILGESTLQEMGDAFGVSASAAQKWRENIKRLAFSFHMHPSCT